MHEYSKILLKKFLAYNKQLGSVYAITHFLRV